MSIHYDKETRAFRFEFAHSINGKRYRITKRLPKTWNRSEAEAFDRTETASLFAIATGVKKDRCTVERAIDLWYSDKQETNKTAAGAMQEMLYVHSFFKGRFVEEMPEIAAEIMKFGKRRWSPATIRNRIAYLRSACRWAWKQHNVCEHDPCGRVMTPQVKNEKKNWLSRLEVLQACRKMRYNSAVDRAARAGVLVAFYSGMRLEEVRRAELKEGVWFVGDTKNDDDAYIPVMPKVACYARRWPRKCSGSSMQQLWKAALIEIGRPDASFHTTRHSTATVILDAGYSLDMVGDVLRHKDKRSTQRYAHRLRGAMAEAMMSLSTKKQPKAA